MSSILPIQVDLSDKTAVYRQIVRQFEERIHSGKLASGTIVPSMNELAATLDISKETVKKAYGVLADKGLLVPQQGKGFYVSDRLENTRPTVLVIFDKFSVYKQTIYNALETRLGDHAELTILNHNQDLNLLAYYLDQHLDNYDYYLIAPHFPLDKATQERTVQLLSQIPSRKLILLDRQLPALPGPYGAIYQDFENDIYDGLLQGRAREEELRITHDIHPSDTNVKRIRVITLPESLYGSHIQRGVKRFCTDYGIPVQFLTSAPDDIAPGDFFLVLNSQLDTGLVGLARSIASAHLTIGKDVFIISYNEFDMNELVLGGLTTVSTDFHEMGVAAAEMILTHHLTKIHCPFRMTRRHTF